MIIHIDKIFFSDHKLYLSFQNISLTIRDDLQDIALGSLSGLVISIENRCAVSYHKLSTKLESFSLEAANMEHDLVYVLKIVEGLATSGKEFIYF